MEDFTSVQASIQESLVATTRSANSLANEDLAFHRSLDKKLGSKIDQQNARLLSLAHRLLGSATENTETVRPPSLKSIDDVDGEWSKVVDVIDSLLERADTALDEFTGAVKRLVPGESVISSKSFGQKPAASFQTQDLARPQLLFEVKPDNNFAGPFRPILTSKPHGVTPLQQAPKKDEDTGQSFFEQPYQHEIEQYTYPSSLYTLTTPSPYSDAASSTATFVDTEEALDEMLEELKQAKEIAVDLEHHDQHSYIGIVSLMQISTRDHDWIIDTLKPWRRKLHRLNEVFANPAILKVLHGAYMDITWLQRDLGIYVVGLFDTYHAARALNYPTKSYAFLLQKFTGVIAQKQYQMADWRIRPLPQELIDYARSDTHYLLYIFDNMKNELIEQSDFTLPDHVQDKVYDVQMASREVALQRYEHPVYDYETGRGSGGWYKMISRTPAVYNKEQFAVFRAVHQWRDQIAREQDDSVTYVMPPHVIFTLARLMPTQKAALLNAAQPLTQTVRLRADELLSVIIRAKQEGQSGPEMLDLITQIDATTKKRVVDDLMRSAPQVMTNGIMPAASKAASGILSSLPLRSITSLFWGSAFKPGNQEQRRESSTQASVQMTLPMPPLGKEVFADAPALEETLPSSEESEPEAEPEIEDEVFVLKQLGKKRKLAEANQDDALADQNDVVALPNSEAERLRLKAERKKARKEAKRAAKATADDDAEMPFDYASAPSILQQSAINNRAHKKNKKQVNPYAKALDTAKGLPRAQKETSGRSMTYAA